MKCEPYETLLVRQTRRWREFGERVGIDPLILRDVFIKHYWRCMQAEDFINAMTRDEKFAKGVRERVSDYDSTPEVRARQQAEQEKIWLEGEDSEILNYRLKQLIEVGDEIVATDTKTYTFSGIEYLTKGKRYRIEELNDKRSDHGLTDFTAITTTNLPTEHTYENVHGIRSLWRNGEEIWNWRKEWWKLYYELNPTAPKGLEDQQPTGDD